MNHDGRGEPIDVSAIPDRCAAALMASGLPAKHWFFVAEELDALRAAGVEITPPIVANLAAVRLRQLQILERDRYVPERLSQQEADDRFDEETAERELETCVVYYMRIGDRVKIGFTSNLPLRVATLMPEEVLATEPGGRKVERQRHQQFAALRVSGEWFELRAPLTEWIADVAGERANA